MVLMCFPAVFLLQWVPNCFLASAGVGVSVKTSSSVVYNPAL